MDIKIYYSFSDATNKTSLVLNINLFKYDVGTSFYDLTR